MRIALVCPYAWDRPGGVQVHVGQLATELRRRGHGTVVLAPGASDDGPGWDGDDIGLRPLGPATPVRYNGSIAPISLDPRVVGRVRRELRAYAPDVTHVHEPFAPLIGPTGVRAAPSAVVGTFHAYADRARSRALDAVAPALRRVWDAVDVRIAVSIAAATNAHRRFVGPMRVIPNGLDIERFASAGLAANLPAGRKMLFLNRLDPRKGFRVAVAAFELLAPQVPDLRLIVAGDGAEREATAALPEAIRSRVSMLGMVPHDEVPRCVASADVVVAPALGGESFGIVLVEAMAASRPVVASDIAGYREVIRQGVDGILVPPQDPAALAAAVRRVLDEPGLAATLASNARERAERFRWSVVAGEIETAYADAIDMARDRLRHGRL